MMANGFVKPSNILNELAQIFGEELFSTEDHPAMTPQEKKEQALEIMFKAVQNGPTGLTTEEYNEKSTGSGNRRATPTSPLGAVAWLPMPAPNDVDILVLMSDGRLDYIIADDNDYSWATPEHYARTPKGQGITSPSAWVLAERIRALSLPTDADLDRAALARPKVRALVDALQVIESAHDGLAHERGIARAALASLDACHD